eukprot:GHVU01060061.1.p1 GENE.GHVU01060061.1~~GHVU01060061.1.p1  ORF type:complete len:254 (-),score=41.84 GHVU01060061.1:98-859(-)
MRLGAPPTHRPVCFVVLLLRASSTGVGVPAAAGDEGVGDDYCSGMGFPTSWPSEEQRQKPSAKQQPRQQNEWKPPEHSWPARDPFETLQGDPGVPSSSGLDAGGFDSIHHHSGAAGIPALSQQQQQQTRHPPHHDTEARGGVGVVGGRWADKGVLDISNDNSHNLSFGEHWSGDSSSAIEALLSTLIDGPSLGGLGILDPQHHAAAAATSIVGGHRHREAELAHAAAAGVATGVGQVPMGIREDAGRRRCKRW